MKKTLLIAAMATLAVNASLWGQNITVTSPAAGDEWCQGTTHTITWTSSGVSGALSIKLRPADQPMSDPVLEIKDSTANDGSYTWAIPASLAPGDYEVRVRTISESPLIYGDSGNFKVKVCAAPGASITVTAPAAGNEWARGTSKTITWTSAGVAGPLSIKLRPADQPMADPVLEIKDSTANDGSYTWAIPASLAPGDYEVRVRTVSESPLIYGDSANFKVTGVQVYDFIPSLTANPRCDLELAGVGVEFYDGDIVAWVKNNGPDALTRHDVKFRLALSGGRESIITRQLTIPVGEERRVGLMPMAASGIPDSGLRTSVSIDTSGSGIHDANRLNQHREVRIAVLDIRCDAPRADLELSKLYLQGGWDYRVKFKIRVRHNLNARAVHNIRVKWELFDDGGIVRGALDSWTIASLAAGEEWVKQVDQKFGKQGRPNAHEPKLTEGRTYRVVASISDPEHAFFDVHTGNNSSSFTFSFSD